MEWSKLQKHSWIAFNLDPEFPSVVETIVKKHFFLLFFSCSGFSSCSALICILMRVIVLHQFVFVLQADIFKILCKPFGPRQSILVV